MAALANTVLTTAAVGNREELSNIVSMITPTDTPIYSLAHGYGPVQDFAQRLAIAWQASQHGVWINRYGYLSDEKLVVAGQVCQRSR